MSAKSIVELHNLLYTKQLRPIDIVNDVIDKLDKYKYLNATVETTLEQAKQVALDLENYDIKDKNFLYAIPYFAKDNFATKNVRTTSSSKILDSFVPSYDAEVIRLLKENNAIMMGKSALDELGMGGHGLYAHTGVVVNPWNKEHIVGGSSSGSAALVSAGVVPFALGTDTGDSIRKPASYVGIVGLKPSYGLISRYGLLPYAPSLDTAGIFTRNVTDAAIVLTYLGQYDQKDSTSIRTLKEDYYSNLTTTEAYKYRYCYLQEVYDKSSDVMKKLYDDLFAKLEQHNIKVESVSFPVEYLKAISPLYMIISFAEAISTHSNLDGINFGVRQKGNTYEEVMINSRTKGFGKVVKRRYVIGSYALAQENQKKLFLKAKKVRRLIVNELKSLFSKYDILILPASETTAPKTEDIINKTISVEDIEHFNDDVLVLSNFMGNPSITIPLGFVDDLPIGVNLNANSFQDQTVLNAALLFEEIIGLQNLTPESREQNNEK